MSDHASDQTGGHAGEHASRGLTVDADGFARDGKPHRIFSGALHYFRVLPQLWPDRLARLRAMGLNTVETYVAWNFHERRQGEYDFAGRRDVVEFIQLAGRAGLDVIVRPGPYICAEWDFGGLPAWLLSDVAGDHPGGDDAIEAGEQPRLRCADPRFLAHVDRWFDVLLARLVGLQAEHGGPIVAMQIENEYGSFGDDAGYLEYLRDGLRARDVRCPLVTSDGPTDGMLATGAVDGALATVNFGSRADDALATLRRWQPDRPAMCMEFWNGWFDHWGESHHLRDAEDAAAELAAVLRAGASVNLYLAHGGTNFGLTNGANSFPDTGYQPTVTSYDYDAPIAESGELTEKFLAFRKVFTEYAAEYTTVPDELPASPARLAARTVGISNGVPLAGVLDTLSTPVLSPTPLSMEQLGQASGLVHYRASARLPAGQCTVYARGVRDRAQVFVDGQPVGVLERNRPDDGITVVGTGEPVTLELLVENQGRVNYGPDLADRKGILGGVGYAGPGELPMQRFVFGWQCRALPLDELSIDRLPLDELAVADSAPSRGPAFYRAEFTIEEPADGFLAFPLWGKGFVWLNGFLLGRYWAIGPQRTLYAPAPLWRAGRNDVVLLELHEPAAAIELRDAPDLGGAPLS